MCIGVFSVTGLRGLPVVFEVFDGLFTIDNHLKGLNAHLNMVFYKMGSYHPVTLHGLHAFRCHGIVGDEQQGSDRYMIVEPT